MGAISLVKTVNHDTKNGGTEKNAFTTGDAIPYSFLVTNTGTSTLSGINISDRKITSITCPKTSLDPADSMVCTGIYSSVTKEEESSGYVNNTATVTGTPADDTNPVSDTSSAKAPTYSARPITLTKNVTGSGASAADGASYTISYSYNAGDYQYCDANGSLQKSKDDSGQYQAANGSFTVKAGQTTTSPSIPVGATVTLDESNPGIAGTTWESSFTPSKTLTIGCGEKSDAVALTNTFTQQPGSVSWTKVDASDQKTLAGSEWILTGPDKTTLTITDNGANDADPADGALKATGLAWGKYTLTEIKAPAGYQLDATEHPFTVDADGLNKELGKISNDRTPTKPTKPGTPTKPSTPVEPSTPTKPSAPVEPTKPGTPASAQTSDKGTTENGTGPALATTGSETIFAMVIGAILLGLGTVTLALRRKSPSNR